jgi:undecaprenyl-diphosphatase
MTAMLGDFISSDIIKENIHRLRPCREPALADSVRFIVSYCPKSSSFTSSHAVNHFAMATFFFITLRNLWGHWAKAFYLWAFIIIYAQVYVGVHYPLDVLSGAIIGSLIGMAIAYAFNKNYNLVD